MIRRLALGFLLLTSGLLAAEKKPALPIVAIDGDGVRSAFAPLVAKRLEGKAVVVSPPEHGGTTTKVLAALDSWLQASKPDIVYLYCGLQDIRRDKKTKKYDVDIEQFVANLRQFTDRVRQETGATVIYGLITPVNDAQHAQRGKPFDRREADVRRYNVAARKFCKEHGITVNDLHRVVEEGGTDKMLLPDGTHLSAAGNERVADAIAAAVLKQLAAKKK